MATYGIREFRARASAILRNLENGEEVIITRRGKPCRKLTAPPDDAMPQQSLATLRGAFRDTLPAATWEDFQEIKKIWEPRPLPEDANAG